MRIAARLGRMGGKTGLRYAGLTKAERSGPLWTGELRASEDLLVWPLSQRRPRRILVNNMSDLFHEQLADATVDLLHAVMAVAHWHHFLVLTKRAERMRAYYSDPKTPRRIAEKTAFLSSAGLLSADPRRPLARNINRKGGEADARARRNGGVDPTRGRPERSVAFGQAGLDFWPLPNLWLGVSVEDQDRITRVRDLLQTPAALRWVCFEPLLDRVRPDAVPVGDTYFDALAGGHYGIDGRGRVMSVGGPAWPPLDWVVTGGEIGSGARPMHPHWIREIRDGCVAAGVPFFFKQWGEWAPASAQSSGQRMTRVGKRAAGRLLDGRTWDEGPPATEAG